MTPALAGLRPQGGWGGVVLRDFVHGLKFLFFNGFAVLTPPFSLASQAMPVAARAVPVPQGQTLLAYQERGVYRRFYLFPFAQENGFSQTLNRF